MSDLGPRIRRGYGESRPVVWADLQRVRTARRHRRAVTAAVTATIVVVAAALTGVSLASGRPSGVRVATGPAPHRSGTGAVPSSVPGGSSSRPGAAVVPTSPTTANPRLPPGWRRASTAQVEAFAARVGHAPTPPNYWATWSVVLLPQPGGGHTATVVTGRGPNEDFYKLTPANAIGGGGVPAPPGLVAGKPGTSYAYYARFAGNLPSVSCSTNPSPPQTWKCVSWAGIQGIGMGTMYELQNPSPAYIDPSAVTNALVHYGYNGPGQIDFPTQPAFISHRRQFGLDLTCLRLGPVARPVGRVCADQHGFVTSYQFPGTASGITPYRTVTLTSYHLHPPASILNPPAPATPPTRKY